MRDSLVPTVLARLSGEYAGIADPDRATAMSAYLRDQFPFLGIPSPRRQAATRAVLTGLPRPTPAELAEIALACWAREHREYQYFACAYLRRFVAIGGPPLLPVIERLLVTKPWWDTVDTLASHTVGPLVRAHPELVSTMDSWIGSTNVWLVRAALLHQLGYRADTDADRLSRYCLLRADDSEFFLRKAIGWALRQYAQTEPDAVRSFVESHRDRLSGLSVREALKHL